MRDCPLSDTCGSSFVPGRGDRVSHVAPSSGKTRSRGDLSLPAIVPTGDKMRRLGEAACIILQHGHVTMRGKHISGKCIHMHAKAQVHGRGAHSPAEPLRLCVEVNCKSQATSESVSTLLLETMASESLEASQK